MASAQILTFPATTQAHTPVPTVAPEPTPDPRQRFEALEQSIRDYRGEQPQVRWLEQYLDAGLELACNAGQKQLWALQESWLHRVYRTLRDTGLNLNASNAWRRACLEALYQPFFALRHLPRGQQDPRCGQRLHVILRDFAVISRHLV